MKDKTKMLLEMLEKHEDEIAYSLQEWGIKNNMRLFGYDLYAMYRPAKGKTSGEAVPTARAYLIDTSFKTLYLLYFTVKEKSGKISVTQNKVGFKWPIKFCKTHEFISKRIIPISPVYGFLIDKGFILPFQSTMKNKDWQALSFIEIGNMKAVNLFEEHK